MYGPAELFYEKCACSEKPFSFFLTAQVSSFKLIPPYIESAFSGHCRSGLSTFHEVGWYAFLPANGSCFLGTNSCW